MASITANGSHMLFGGDYNARDTDFGDFAGNRLGSLLKNVTSDAGLLIHSPPSPTCFHAVEGSFIDKFVGDCTFPFAMSALNVLPSFSDHAGVGVAIHCRSFDLVVRNGFQLRQFGLVNVNRMNRFIEEEMDALHMPINILEDDMEHLAERTSDIFSRAVEQFVPSKFIRTNGIILSSTSQTLIRKCHTAQRKFWRNRGAGLWLPSVRAIANEVKMLRQMMINSIGRDLSNNYREKLAKTDSISCAYKTVVTHTSYRRRSKCPTDLYTDDAKAVGVFGERDIANCFRDRFAANHGLELHFKDI